MNGMNNQAMLGAGQPFRAELTQRQESSGGGGVVKVIGKIIITLVIIGIAIVSLPFVFCLIGMYSIELTGGNAMNPKGIPFIIGLILALGGVGFVIGLAIYLIRKIFKKK